MISGLIKLNDPVGFSWTLENYFRSFAADFTPLFLKLLPFSLGLAIAIATVELVLGVALLVGFWFQLTLYALLLLTSFFTGLSFYTALFKKLGSCGCFGDLIPLTPWQSFFKSNWLLVALYFLHRYKPQDIPKSTRLAAIRLGCVLVTSGLGISIAWYTYQHLPMVDGSPYQRGSNLAKLGQPKAPLYYQYILEKDGQQIASPSYPADTTYRLVSTRLLNPLDKPAISNLTIWNEQGEITNEVLAGTKLLIINQYPTQVKLDTYVSLASFLKKWTDQVQPIILIPFHEQKSSVSSELTYPLAWASPDLLKAMLKARLGFVLLREGIIVGKWTYQDRLELQQALTKLVDP